MSADGGLRGGAPARQEQVMGSRAPGRLASKVGVVTGASAGTGAAVAERAAAEGAAVVVGARIRIAGGRARFLATDVTVEAEVARLTRMALDAYGRLDSTFNNAGGVSAPGAVSALDAAGW